VLNYIDGPVPSDPIIERFEKYIDRKAKVVRSNTGQLEWNYAGRGYYTVNTPGTQAVIGWGGGRLLDFDDVTISSPMNTELKLYVTAMGPDETIRDAKSLLISAFGREVNKEAVLDEFSESAFTKGEEQLVLEPVTAAITIKGRSVRAVRPLDHAGRIRKGAPVAGVAAAPEGDTFTIDGRTSKTMYYLVEVE
jgi:hypothetical protein